MQLSVRLESLFELSLFKDAATRHFVDEVVIKGDLCVAAGRFTCPPEITGSLIHALFRHDEGAPLEPDSALTLTRRESEVLELHGQGLSNKEIGDQLCLSVATVKHHVLEKLKLPRRARATRKVRDPPWIAHTATMQRKKKGSKAY
jgi:DNA-binding NarL/FixJ family response regulator